MKRHPAREFLEHIGKMFEIAANKKLRLFRRDIESRFAASIEYGIFFTFGSRHETDSPIEESRPAP